MKLYPFQKEDIKKWYYDMDGRGIFDWCIGSGKTYCGAGLVRKMVNDGMQVLIIATKSLIPDWVENVEEQGVVIYNYQNKKKQELQQTSIVSYDNLHKVINEHYDFLIADEIHKCKSFNSKRGQYFRQLARKTRFLLMMSGTLWQHRDSSELINYLWSLDTNRIRNSLPENITRFRAAHCKEVVMESGYRFHVTLASGTKLINNLITPYVCTRKTEDVLDLPEHMIKKLPIICEYNQKELAKKLSEDLQMSIDLAYEKPHIMHALQMANGIDPDTKELVVRDKIDALIEKLGDIPEDKQVIVWTYWKTFTEAVGKSLKVKPITGDTTDAERQTLIRNFKSGKQRFLIASMGTIAEGFNLQNCSVQIFANIWYDYIKYEQCKGRIYRNGQKSRTFTYLLYSKGTIEEDALHILNQKMNMNEANNYLKSILLKRYGGKV